MTHPRQSALQRIQVGIIGLVVVLLFVSLANMALDRAVNAPGIAPGGGGVTGTEIATETKNANNAPNAPNAPLAELGVTPVGDGAGATAIKPVQVAPPRSVQ